MNKFSREWKTIQKYIANGHNSSTLHNSLSLVDAYHVGRPGELDRFKPFEGTKRKLLWHGSRLCNYVGILNQGLRIAPKEGPLHFLSARTRFSPFFLSLEPSSHDWLPFWQGPVLC